MGPLDVPGCAGTLEAPPWPLALYG